jgi:hypothetical protein
VGAKAPGYGREGHSTGEGLATLVLQTGRRR